MARIELRNTSIFLEDGLSGSAAVDVAGVADAATTAPVKNVDTNANDANTTIPVGARITFAGDLTVYTVQTADVPTTTITFTPAKNGAAVDDDVITVLSQRLEIKIGEGDLSWTEAREFIYDLDRDRLDTVRQGQDQPVSVDLAFTYESVTASTGNPPTPVDALNQDGEASEWVNSSSDPCEPYAVDIVAINCVPCGTDEDEEVRFADFRYESLDYSIQDASIAVSGQCNITRVSATRSDNPSCS